MTMTRRLILENWSENYTKLWKQMPVTGEKMTPNSGLSIRKWAVMMNLGKMYPLMAVIDIKWALARQNLYSGICEQQRRRPACASAQSDQHLCFSLFVKYHILFCFRRNFNFIASLCS